MTSNLNNLFQTNNYSIVSKYSAVRSGYFQDLILQELVENTLGIESWRRTPLVNRGYAARLLAMEWVIKVCIEIEHVDCFIILGSGYDTLPFRWMVKNASCTWIEIDLPQVVEIKSKFIIDKKIMGNGDELNQVEDGIFSSSSSRYHLIACDLKQTEELSKSLKKVLSLIGTRREICIVNEVCFCYLELKDILNIMTVVIKLVEDMAFRVYYVGYEQVKPIHFSPFSKIMIDHFKTLRYPLKHYPTSRELREFLYKSLRFTYEPNVSNMFQIFHNVLMEDKLEIKAFQEEPFDEFEEMDLYLGHYALVKGLLILKDPFNQDGKQEGFSRMQNFDDEVSRREEICTDWLRAPSIANRTSTSFIESPIRRYGHASCSLDKSIIISGGFGVSESNQFPNHQHRRLHDCIVLKKVNGTFESYSLNLDVLGSNISLDRIHGQIAGVSENLLFFNGGRQSPLKQKPTNINFIAEVLEDDKSLRIKHKFNFRKTESTLRWRHRLTPVMDGLCLQVGGIGTNVDSTLFFWNLSSDKCGSVEGRSFKALNRHSFAMDMKDRNVALIYGGLQTDSLSRDYPVDEETSVLLYDIRSDEPHEVFLKTYEPSYGASVHFISDTNFIRIGGISTKTGLLYNGIELVDLRNETVVQLIDNIVDESTLDVPFLLTSSATCHSKEDKTILTLGGGGNFFTFGTHFSQHHLLIDYSQI